MLHRAYDDVIDSNVTHSHNTFTQAAVDHVNHFQVVTGRLHSV